MKRFALTLAALALTSGYAFADLADRGPGEHTTALDIIEQRESAADNVASVQPRTFGYALKNVGTKTLMDAIFVNSRDHGGNAGDKRTF